MEEVVIVRDNYCIPRVTDAEENQWFPRIFHRCKIFSNIAGYFLFLIRRLEAFQKVMPPPVDRKAARKREVQKAIKKRKLRILLLFLHLMRYLIL